MDLVEQSINWVPDGLKVGDFIQTLSHFGDIYFEVTRYTPGSNYISFAKYEKYGGKPLEDWTMGRIKRFIPAEMAVPVMVKKRLRFKATFGQYDPIYGFAPVGTPLRNKGDW